MRTCLFVPHRAAPDRIHCPAPPPCNRDCQFRSRLTLAEARVRGRSPAQKKELRHPWLRTSGCEPRVRRSAPQGGLNVRQAAVVSFSRSGQVTLTPSIRPPLPAIGLAMMERFLVVLSATCFQVLRPASALPWPPLAGPCGPQVR